MSRMLTTTSTMCSMPGQAVINKAIKDNNLTGVVVAACSPRLHEPTFRTATKEGGLNPFRFEMANIREQNCMGAHARQRGINRQGKGRQSGSLLPRHRSSRTSSRRPCPSRRQPWSSVRVLPVCRQRSTSRSRDQDLPCRSRYQYRRAHVPARQDLPDP